MNLRDAFTQLAPRVGVDRELLLAYAAQDSIGGYHANGSLAKWPMGSLWEVEGQILYALVRALKPGRVLEIGTYFACSSTHILQALHDNASGELISIDIEPVQGDGPPAHLRDRWRFVQAEAGKYITENNITADFVYEDAFHLEDETSRLLSIVRSVVHPKFIVSHDAMHFSVGAAVRNAHIAALGKVEAMLVEPSDCGLAWWSAQ